MIKKIIDYIKNYFRDYSVKETNKKIEEQEKENSISFIVDEWNRLIIKVGIDNKNKSSCEAFGQMLFFINNGAYEQNILNIMEDMTKKNPEQSQYVTATMISWANSILEQTEKDSTVIPMVRPTEVFLNKS